mgnify:CR=1 FL=1
MLTGATRLGPELAYAVLTILFFNYNIKRLGLFYLPASCFRLTQYSPQSQLAGFKGDVMARRFPSSQNNKDDPENVYARFTAATDDINVENIYDYAKRMCSILDGLAKYHVMCLTLIKSIKFSTEKGFEGFSKSGSEDERNSARIRLDVNLAKFKKSKVPMDENGDCAFLSIAYGLKRIFSCKSPLSAKTMEAGNQINASSYNLHLLQHCDLAPDSVLTLTLSQLSYQLRKSFVDYILQPKVVAKFQPKTLLNRTSFTAEAMKFVNPGVFSGEIGDLLMAVMSDLLGCPIVVITSIENYPVLTLFPESLHLQDSIFVAFNQSGPGHYDATVDLSESIDPGSDLPVLGERDEVPNKNFPSRDLKTYCRCGENSTDHNKVSCTDVERKTRCPCYKIGEKCTTICRCKNCHNGKAESAAVPWRSEGISRKRKVSGYSHVSSECFLRNIGASVAKGECTMLERCVIVCIREFLTRDAIDRVGKFNPGLVHTVYTKVVKCSTDDHKLRDKSLKSITALLNSMQ